VSSEISGGVSPFSLVVAGCETLAGCGEGFDSLVADVLASRFAAWRRKPKMLRPLSANETPSMVIAPSPKLTSPPLPTKEVTKKSEAITVGTVTVPEKVVARVILLRTNPKYRLRPVTLARLALR